jgi:hypothetical protein
MVSLPKASHLRLIGRSILDPAFFLHRALNSHEEDFFPGLAAIHPEDSV